MRQLSDFKGADLVRNVLALIDREKPIHVSLVGGDPLVRYKELEVLLPELDTRKIHTQVVTSAFREIPKEWSRFSRLNVVASDGFGTAQMRIGQHRIAAGISGGVSAVLEHST